MKLYLAHASSYDYQTELYEPLKQTIARQHQIVFPHDEFIVNTRETILASDLVVAEVTHASTGEGIELGWASAGNIPIVCLFKIGTSYSSSLPFVSDTFIGYSSTSDMVAKLSSWLAEYGDVAR